MNLMHQNYDQNGQEAALMQQGQHKICRDNTSAVALDHFAGEPDLKHYGKVWFEPYA